MKYGPTLSPIDLGLPGGVGVRRSLRPFADHRPRGLDVFALRHPGRSQRPLVPTSLVRRQIRSNVPKRVLLAHRRVSWNLHIILMYLYILNLCVYCFSLAIL